MDEKKNPAQTTLKAEVERGQAVHMLLWTLPQGGGSPPEGTLLCKKKKGGGHPLHAHVSPPPPIWIEWLWAGSSQGTFSCSRCTTASAVCSQQIVVWGKRAAGHAWAHRRGDNGAQLLLGTKESSAVHVFTAGCSLSLLKQSTTGTCLCSSVGPKFFFCFQCVSLWASQLFYQNMGCSSSSAQTVDQEKRPGTKPEESNGDTVGK